MAGIYVHVPFCHAKCAYCDFYSIANRSLESAYVEAVGREYAARRSELGDSEVQTVYFGGGTPSILSIDEFARMMSFFPCAHEVTIEVNPEDVTAAAVEAWIRSGVNRVSMGVQSLVDSELKAVGRRHSSAEALRAIDVLRKGGVMNISCDLIYGLPGQTAATWKDSVRGILSTGIEHLSAYALTYEPGTLLTRRLERGDIVEASEDLTEEMYHILCREALSAGMEHYEISNFAKPGFRSRHNSAYWTGEPYLGLGPGAHSLGCDGLRRFVPSSVKDYVLAPETAAVVDRESDADRVNDTIMVSLRTREGLSPEDIPKEFREELYAGARRHIRRGTLTEKDGRLLVPEQHWLLADSIIRDLFVE